MAVFRLPSPLKNALAAVITAAKCVHVVVEGGVVAGVAVAPAGVGVGVAVEVGAVQCRVESQMPEEHAVLF